MFLKTDSGMLFLNLFLLIILRRTSFTGLITTFQKYFITCIHVPHVNIRTQLLCKLNILKQHLFLRGVNHFRTETVFFLEKKSTHNHNIGKKLIFFNQLFVFAFWTFFDWFLFGSAQTKGSLKFVFDHYQDIIIIIIIISNDTEMKMKKNWFQEKSRFERRSLHMSNVWNSSGRNERFENIFGFLFFKKDDIFQNRI